MSGYAVYRIDGGLLAATAEGTPYTEAQAEARCQRANADAEKLDIEARYEVREFTGQKA